jgi:hypothetical protein
MTQRKTPRHVAIAGLALAVLLFGGEGAAFGQLGNLLDKAKQAGDAARKAVDAAKDATGTAAVAPAAPTRIDAPPTTSAIQRGTDSSCLNPIEETLGAFQRYKNNCGVDIGVLTKNADGRTCSTGGVKTGQLGAIPPGSAVCRGFPERGPGCECPSGTGMENPSNRRFGVTTGARPGVVSGMRQDRPNVAGAHRADASPASVAGESAWARSAVLVDAPTCLAYVSSEHRGKVYANQCGTAMTLLLRIAPGSCTPMRIEPNKSQIVAGEALVCQGRLDPTWRECRCP